MDLQWLYFSPFWILFFSSIIMHYTYSEKNKTNNLKEAFYKYQFKVLEAFRVFRLCLIAMLKVALWVGAAGTLFLMEYPEM